MNAHFYRRKLPHFQPEEEMFFMTFRLAGSIPISVLDRFKETYELLKKGIINLHNLCDQEQRQLLYAAQKKVFALADDFLDNNPNEPYWLGEKAVAEIITEAIHHRDGKLYDLQAFTIMPNHVHMVMKLLPGAPVLFKVMQDLKKYTGLQSNRYLGRDGQFWEEESYDHIVRKEDEFYRIVNYILRNPVKARFVRDWKQWPFTFVKTVLLYE
jgi:REP element-mobilizing transposase RayT